MKKKKVFGNVVRIRSNHGTEFQNFDFSSFCSGYGVKHEFSAPKTPQQNGAVERKNQVVQETARVTMQANC